MKNETTLHINGVQKKVISEMIDQKLWFKIDEQIYSFDIIDLNQSSYAKSKAQTKSPDKITSPMPGKITKIFVSAGQTVNKGDALIVMEAMKMEYTLKADISSSVEKINVQVGDQVTLGHLLIQLKVQTV